MQQQSFKLTLAGWAALILSVGLGLGLAIALPIWFPEQFAAEGRHDPRHQAKPYPILFIPLAAGGFWILLRLCGIPIIRSSDPPESPHPDRGTPRQRGPE
jgi:hypothetical protein